MELSLNLVWVLVAGGLTVSLLRHWRGRASGRSWASVLTSALFIAVLLFPAISASDDLHSDLFLFEDASRRTFSAISAHPDLTPASATVVLSLEQFSPSLGKLVYAGRMVEASQPIVLPSSCRPASGLRAPPATRFL